MKHLSGIAGMAAGIVLVTGTLLASPAPAQEVPFAPAPEAGEQLVDRVVAVVGDTAVLMSDIQGELMAMQQQGEQIPSDPRRLEGLVRDLLDQRIDDLILTHHARRAGHEVNEAEIADRVRRDVEEVRSRFPSEAAFVRALAQSGITLDEYRAQLESQYRGRMLSEDFLSARLGQRTPPHVSEAEMEAFFESNRQSIGELPARISFHQVVIRPEASESAMEEARTRAREIRDRLNRGEDFGELARRFSEDPGSRERDGDLGWFRRGQMVPEFDQAVFGMRPGQTSGLVETEFGIHIIRLDRVRGGERQARHILIRAERTDEDVERARRLAEQVAERAQAGESMRELGRTYSAPEERRTVESQPVDRLPDGYRAPLEAARTGQVVGPFEIEGTAGVTFAVVEVTERVDAGEATLDDVRDQVRSALQQQRMVESLVEELRERTHIRVML